MLQDTRQGQDLNRAPSGCSPAVDGGAGSLHLPGHLQSGQPPSRGTLPALQCLPSLPDGPFTPQVSWDSPPLPGPTLAMFPHAGHEAPTTGHITTVSSVIITTAAQPHLCPGRTLSHSLVQPQGVVGRDPGGHKHIPACTGSGTSALASVSVCPQKRRGLSLPVLSLPLCSSPGHAVAAGTHHILV